MGSWIPVGGLAQLGERRPCKAEVVGSNPISSTKFSENRIGSDELCRMREAREILLRVALASTHSRMGFEREKVSVVKLLRAHGGCLGVRRR